MPDWMPEDNQAAPQDNSKRSLAKLLDQLYDVFGDCGPTWFPEGSEPKPQDSIGRLREKINAILD
jgi:hypothetical protein